MESNLTPCGEDDLIDSHQVPRPIRKQQPPRLLTERHSLSHMRNFDASGELIDCVPKINA